MPTVGGEDLDLGADGGFVVGESGEVEVEGVVFFPADVLEPDGGGGGGGDEQVGCAVAVDIHGDEAARVGQGELVKFVQTEVAADVFESAVALVAEHTDACAVGGLDDDGEVDPTVVVEVDGGDAPCASYVFGIFEGEWDALKGFAVAVAPEGDARSAVVGHGQVHPAVLVVVENGDAAGGAEFFHAEERLGGVFALSGVDVDERGGAIGGGDDVDGTVIIDVGEDDGAGGSGSAEAGGVGPLGEGLVAVVAPEDAGVAAGGEGAAGDEEVEVAVVVVVDKAEALGVVEGLEADGGGGIFKVALAAVVEEQELVVEGYGEVVEAVGIVVSDGAGDGVAAGDEAGVGCGEFREGAVAVVAIDVDGAGAGAHEDEVGDAVTVDVEDAGSAGEFLGEGVGYWREDAFLREVDGNGRMGHGGGGVGHGHGVVPLFSVSEAEGGCDLGAGEVLEADEVGVSFGGPAGALQGAGHREFRRRVDRILGESEFEDFDGLGQALEVLEANALEVEGVGAGGVKLDGVLEGGEGGFELVGGAMDEAEVVPGARVSGVEGGGALERCLGLGELLQGEQSDAVVERGLFKGGVEGCGLGKVSLGALGLLLVHHGDAAVVEQHGLRVGLSRRGECGRHGKEGKCHGQERGCTEESGGANEH